MLLIGTPCYNGTVTIQYMRSAISMLEVLNRAGVGVDFLTPSHESLITRARNFIANDFLRQKRFSHLLFIDSDLEFPPEAPLRFLRSGLDLLCGVYPVKHLDIDKLRSLPASLAEKDALAASLNYTARFKPDSRVDGNGFVQVEYGPCGFMLIARAVLEKMAQAYPELRYGGSYVNTSDDAQTNFAFFDTAIDPGSREYLPEDYAFCRRWTAMGGTVFADVNSRFTHMGTFAYPGDFPAFLTQLGK